MKHRNLFKVLIIISYLVISIFTIDVNKKYTRKHKLIEFVI